MTPTFDYASVSALRPCATSFKAAAHRLGGVAAWKARAFTFTEMREAGIPINDLLWLATSASQNDKNVEHRLRLWMADCAARVLPILERERPGDQRAREAIVAARAFARGEIRGDELAARAAGADSAARAAMAAGAADAASAASAAWAASLNGVTLADWVTRAAWVASADRAAEAVWQLDRFVSRMSDPEPEDWPLDAPQEQTP